MYRQVMTYAGVPFLKFVRKSILTPPQLIYHTSSVSVGFYSVIMLVENAGSIIFCVQHTNYNTFNFHIHTVHLDIINVF
jgi:hypothetical protein